jgi:hypothetical protein
MRGTNKSQKNNHTEETLTRLQGRENGRKMEKGNYGLLISNIHPRKTDTQNPKKKLNKNFQTVISFPTNFVTFSTKKIGIFKEFFN